MDHQFRTTDLGEYIIPIYIPKLVVYLLHKLVYLYKKKNYLIVSIYVTIKLISTAVYILKYSSY